MAGGPSSGHAPRPRVAVHGRWRRPVACVVLATGGGLVAPAVAGGGGAVAGSATAVASTLGLGASAGAAGADGTSGHGSSTETPATGGLVTVGQAAPVPHGAAAIGPLSPSAQISLDVALEPAVPRALDRFVSEVSNPSSPEHGHYLGKGQFAARFGPSVSATAALRSQLAAEGLSVGATSADGLLLHVSGSAAVVSAALHVTLQRYRLAGGRTGFAATSAPKLPASVAAGVVGFTGLSDLVREHPLLQAARHGDGSASTGIEVTTGAGSSTSSQASGPTACSAATAKAKEDDLNTWTQLAKAYGFTTDYDKGDLGAGVTVGIFELEPYLTSDLTAFEKCFALPTGEHYGTVQNVPVDGGAGAGGGFGEAILDVEDVVGLAPEANVLVYGAPNSDLGALDEYDLIVSEDRAQVISTSWGECEPESTAVAEAVEGEIFEEAAAQGQTVFAAAGDTGSEDCHNSTATATTTASTKHLTTALAVDDPASQPYVTGVGGTELTITSGHPTAADEVVWNSRTATPSKPRDIAGGGGVSARWAKPGWQATGRTAVPLPGTGTCAVAPGSTSTTTRCRQVPDVAASADPTKGGDDIYCAGSVLCTTYATAPSTTGWTAVGGTSAAAPLWAAFAALADESCGADVGFLNPRLYELGDGSGDFHDVTSGTNDATGANHGLYKAGPGYDNASGLGSPDGQNLLAALCPSGVSGPAVGLSTNVAGASATYTVTFTAEGALAGGDTLTLVGPSGTTFPAASGDYSVASPTANATTQVAAFATGSSATNNAVTVTLGDPVAGDTSVTVTVRAVVNTDKAGSHTLVVETTADSAASVAAAFTVQAGRVSPTASTLAVPPSVHIGTTSGRVTVTLFDQWGNPASTVRVRLTGSAAPTTSTAKITPGTQTAVSSTTGAATFGVADTKSQAVAFTASVTLTTISTPVGRPATVDFTALSNGTAELTTDDAGATTGLSVGFTTPGALPGGSTITVTAPPGSVVPSALGSYSVAAETRALGVTSARVGKGGGSTSDNQATVTVATAVAAADGVKIGIAGMTNPTAAGAAFVAVSTSVETVPADPAVTIVPGPVDPAESSVVVHDPSGPADGSSRDTVLVTLKDEWGNPVTARSVTAAATGSARLTRATGVTDGTGQALFAVVDPAAQTVSVTATSTATQVGSATVSFTGISGLSYEPTSPTGSTEDLTTGARVGIVAFAELSGAVAARGTLTLTAPPGTALPTSKEDYLLENAFGESQGFTGTVEKGPGSSTANRVTFTLGSPSRFGQKDEIAVVLVTGATNPASPGPGYATLSATGTMNTAPSYSEPLTFVVGPASAARSTVAATPATVGVGQTSTVTVTVEDAAENRLGDQVVSLTPSSAAATVTGDGSTTTPHQSTTSAAGVAAFSVTDGSAQSVSFAAKDVTEGIGLDSVTVTFSTPPAPSPPAPPPSVAGYDLVGSDGGVFVFPTGQATGFYGSLPGLTPPVDVDDIVGIVPTDDYTGYDLVGRDGGVFVFPTGQATGFYGSLPGLTPPVDVDDIVGIVPTDDYTGYDLVGRDGGVFVFPTGQASGFFGSLPGEGIDVDDIVGIAVTGDDKGYWLAASTGHVYNLGDAPAVTPPATGSPIVGVAADSDSKGGWLVARNGSVYPFGDAASYGTLPGSGTSIGDVVSVVPTPSGQGYWLIAADGRVFAFGDATSQGTLPSLSVSVTDVVGAVPTG